MRKEFKSSFEGERLRRKEEFQNERRKVPDLTKEIYKAEEGGEYEKVEELEKSKKEVLGRLRKMILEFVIDLGPLDWSLILDFFEVKEKKRIGFLLKGLKIPLSLEEIEKVIGEMSLKVISINGERVGEGEGRIGDLTELYDRDSESKPLIVNQNERNSILVEVRKGEEVLDPSLFKEGIILPHLEVIHIFGEVYEELKLTYISPSSSSSVNLSISITPKQAGPEYLVLRIGSQLQTLFYLYSQPTLETKLIQVSSNN